MSAKQIASPVKPAPRRAPVDKVAAARKSPPRPKVQAAKGETTGPTDRKPPKQRVRVVRDSFTMPESDFALIATLKGRAMAAQREARKSELLRAGLHALMALDGAALVGALARLQPLKLGRPKKGH